MWRLHVAPDSTSTRKVKGPSCCIITPGTHSIQEAGFWPSLPVQPQGSSFLHVDCDLRLALLASRSPTVHNLVEGDETVSGVDVARIMYMEQHWLLHGVSYDRLAGNSRADVTKSIHPSR